WQTMRNNAEAGQRQTVRETLPARRYRGSGCNKPQMTLPGDIQKLFAQGLPISISFIVKETPGRVVPQAVTQARSVTGSARPLPGRHHQRTQGVEIMTDDRS